MVGHVVPVSCPLLLHRILVHHDARWQPPLVERLLQPDDLLEAVGLLDHVLQLPLLLVRQLKARQARGRGPAAGGCGGRDVEDFGFGARDL